MSGNHNKHCSANNPITIKDYVDSINVKYPEMKQTEYKEEWFDPVEKPKHYMLFPEYGIEVRDLMKLLANQLDEHSFQGLLISDYIQAMQYLLRWHNKNGLEDIKKSIWYLNKIVEQLEEDIE